LGDPGAFPVTAGHRGPLLADVQSQERAVLGQTTRETDRGVTGEGSDLHDVPGAVDPGEQGGENTLLGADLHALAVGKEPGRFLDQVTQNGVDRITVVDDVGVQFWGNAL